MSDTDPSPVIHSVTEGGIAADHIPLPVPQALVATTHSKKEHNTIKSSLVPFACWHAKDVRFEFESSFVLPGIAKEIKVLKELIERHALADAQGEPQQKPSLSVFGHADPTGSDDFNKALSGRRAQALYGLLIRKVELWEDLYSHPLGHDDWELKAIHTLQQTLQRPVTKRPDRASRQELFRAYMDQVCTMRDGQGQAFRFALKPTDFLADGLDPGGKGDYQGCSEFNPVLVFSSAEAREFSDPKKKTERDTENAPNRRVLIYLFRPGIRIAPESWPCPRAKEGATGCKKRFWSDGEKRRGPQTKRREFEKTKDTFACRFYDRLATRSPCERGSSQWGVYWITQAPEAREQGELVLVVQDEGGSEVARLNASAARQGPGDFLTFDLSSLKRSGNFRLELQAGGRGLGTRFGLRIANLFGSIGLGDLNELAANLFRVGAVVVPPQTPTPPAVDATGGQYQELHPPQSNLIT